jgi:hypothetical protein
MASLLFDDVEFLLPCADEISVITQVLQSDIEQSCGKHQRNN